MTLYLLDANVMRELHAGGHSKVQAWLETIDDSNIRISVYTAFEMRRGRVAERERLKAKGRSTTEIDTKIAGLDALFGEAGFQIVPLDYEVVVEWTERLGARNNNLIDIALVATALTHDLVLVSRNRKDLVGTGVKLLDPFKWPCEIEIV